MISQETAILMNRARLQTFATGLAGADLATAISLAAPARAQTYDPNYPVCLQVYDDMVHYYFECAYTSIPQCQASASGRAAQCVVNPYYAPQQPKPQQARPYRHKKRTVVH